MADKGIIFDIKKFSIHDGPGIRTTVFLKGCPLQCRWCHNPEGQSPEPETMSGRKKTAGSEVTVDWVIKEIEKDRIFYEQSNGGATFSGGEPLMQPEFLRRLLAACREKKIHTALDTSGYAPPELFRTFFDAADLFLFDCKLIDEQLHKKYTGVSNKTILANLAALDKADKRIFVRYLVVPGITDNTEHIEAAAAVIASLRNVEEVDVLGYHKLAAEKYRRLGKEFTMGTVDAPSDQILETVKKTFERHGLKACIGG